MRQVLAGLFLTNMDPTKAPPMDAELAAYLTDATNHRPPLHRSKSSVVNSNDRHGPDRLEGTFLEVLPPDLSPPDSGPSTARDEPTSPDAPAPSGEPPPPAAEEPHEVR